MSDMNNKFDSVHYLDGFLSSLALLRGEIREFSSSAYVIGKKGTNECKDVESLLIEYYEPQWKIGKLNVTLLEHGLREFNVEINNLLLNDLFYASSEQLNSKKFMDRLSYISFRLMDIVDDIAELQKGTKFYKLVSTANKNESECLFFCISMLAGAYLVIQFNDDRK